MRNVNELAGAIERSAESLAGVLDPSRCEHLAPVSPAQLRVLLLVRAQPRINVNGLAEALQVGASSASRLCDRLEALGLIERAVDPRDRREVKLRLTTTANGMLDALSDYRRRSLAAVLMRMSPSARDELGRGLAEFSAAAESAEDAVEWERTA